MLSTASAAFSHIEGMFHGLQFKFEGQEALTVRYTYLSSWAAPIIYRYVAAWLAEVHLPLQLGSPHHIPVCGCVAG